MIDLVCLMMLEFDCLVMVVCFIIDVVVIVGIDGCVVWSNLVFV